VKSYQTVKKSLSKSKEVITAQAQVTNSQLESHNTEALQKSDLSEGIQQISSININLMTTQKVDQFQKLNHLVQN
jgi:hypothetical protein